MTTCSIADCRNEGSLLLHIKHKRENLVQAEYCPTHFCTLAQQWTDDIELANKWRVRYFYRIIEYGDPQYGKINENIYDSLRMIWKAKNILPRYASADMVDKALAEEQAHIIEKIRAVEDSREDSGHSRKYTKRMRSSSPSPSPSPSQT